MRVHDILQAEDLISGFSFENLLADRGLTPIASAPESQTLARKP